MNGPALIPWETFKWVLTVPTVLGVIWVMLDVVHLARLRGKDFTDPVNRDKRFGYIMGIGIGLGVTYGLLRYHGVM